MKHTSVKLKSSIVVMIFPWRLLALSLTEACSTSSGWQRLSDICYGRRKQADIVKAEWAADLLYHV